MPISVQNKGDVAAEFDEEEEEVYDRVMKQLSEYKICKFALGFILGISKHAWRTCSEAVKRNQVPVHGLTGTRTNSARVFDTKVKKDLVQFFLDLQLEAQPRSTLAVRTETGAVSLKKADTEIVELPTHYSKRGLYVRFCRERGWHLERKQQGHYAVVNVSDAGDTSNRPPLLDWRTFRRFWKREFPKLILSKPRVDMCTLCHKFHNRFKYCSRAKDPPQGEESDDEDDGLPCWFVESKKSRTKKGALETSLKEPTGATETSLKKSLGATEISLKEFSGAPEISLRKPGATEISLKPVNGLELGQEVTDMPLSDTEVQLESDEDLDYNKTIEDASLHVKQAADMRRYCNDKIKQAQIDDTANKSHQDKCYSIVMDYSQNISLPQVGQSQPGKTYYWSPLKVFLFGIVNCGVPGGECNSYVYHEGQGKKGMTNVASLLMLFLKQKGWSNDPLENDAGKELNIIMDNCTGKSSVLLCCCCCSSIVLLYYHYSLFLTIFFHYYTGQNKNNTVLRLALFLVDGGYFQKVNCIFYIVG